MNCHFINRIYAMNIVKEKDDDESSKILYRKYTIKKITSPNIAG